MLRIGIDIDDTICDFMGQYLIKYGHPKADYEITYNVEQNLIKDKTFWLSLPVIHRPDFEPKLYCTKRVHSKRWTKQYLINNSLPIAPIYQVYCYTKSKAPMIKGRVDVFIDDSLSNFIDLNLNEIPCLLINASHNQSWPHIGRIFSLKEKEIENEYNRIIKHRSEFKEYCKQAAA